MELLNVGISRNFFQKLYKIKEGFNAAAKLCSEQLNLKILILCCDGIGKLLCYSFGKAEIFIHL